MTILAGTALEAPETRLHEPVERPENNDPQMGEVWRFNDAGQFTKNGRHRALVTLVFPKRQRVGQTQGGTPLYTNTKTVNFAIDYTGLKPYPLHRLEQTWHGDYMTALKVSKEHVLANRNTKHEWLDVLLGTEKRDVAIICATGPSLKKAAAMLKHVNRDRAYIIALNSAIDAVGRENVDYHFGLDRRFKTEWSKGCSDIVGVFHPQVSPEALTAYKQVYFYGHPGRSYACEAFRSFYSDYLFGVAELEQAANVGPSAMHFAYLMGAKVIIWLGLDSGWAPDGATHWKPNVNGLDYSQDNVTLRVTGPDGEIKAVYESKTEYIMAAHYTFGHAYWLQKAGIRVINCTGWGMFYDHALVQQPFSNFVRQDLFGEERLLPPCEPYPLDKTLKALGLWR